MNNNIDENELIITIGNELYEIARANGNAIAYIDVYKMLPDADKNRNKIPLHKIGYIGYLLGKISSYTCKYHHDIFLSSLVCRKGQPYFPGEGYFQMLKENAPTLKIPEKEEKEKRKILVQQHQNEAIKHCKDSSKLFDNYPRS